MKRTARIVLLVPLLAACQEGSPPVTMPAGYESAALGRAFRDVRAERPKARLVQEGGDVYLQEREKPPHYSFAQIWFHSAASGPAPSEDQLKVNRTVFATLPPESWPAAAQQAGKAEDAQLSGMRKVQGERFQLVKSSTETAFGKPTACDPSRLACEWTFPDYQVRLYTVDATDKLGKPVPIALQYVIRATSAPDLPPPAPLSAPAAGEGGEMGAPAPRVVLPPPGPEVPGAPEEAKPPTQPAQPKAEPESPKP